MNNLSSYCGLVDAKIRAFYKDLPVLILNIFRILKKHFFMVGTWKKQVWLQVFVTPKEKRQPDLHKKPIKHVCQVRLNQEAFVNPVMGNEVYSPFSIQVCYLRISNYWKELISNQIQFMKLLYTDLGFCKMGQYKIYKCLWHMYLLKNRIIRGRSASL